ncbi:uncharacterized protein N7487_005114 [Penicillium crustosum]|uniref:uncharacterized protein n=1 Tax=Penicillium crustosum TaxID=36656 RepID=UPI002396B59A|nr:uncharacterized protein N7487_005114 [Penicillium crustosum]KAJ5410755.1 hypothetical protein N7487_005114 [Penicillium crustosum]
MPFIDDLPIMTEGNMTVLQAMPTDITYIIFDRLSLEIETLLRRLIGTCASLDVGIPDNAVIQIRHTTHDPL